jgi:hypothetical protein
VANDERATERQTRAKRGQKAQIPGLPGGSEQAQKEPADCVL